MPAGAAVWVCMLMILGVGPNADGLVLDLSITLWDLDGHGGKGDALFGLAIEACASVEGPALLPPAQHDIDRFFDAQCRVVERQRILGCSQGCDAAGLVLASRHLEVNAKVIESSLNSL